MKKMNKVLFSVTMVLVLLFPSVANAYVIDTTYQLTLNEGDNRRAANKFVILHEVGTESSAINNAIYMKRAWSTNQAYTQFIVGDGGKVYKVGEDGYVSWGAGSYANDNSPVQIELARTFNPEQFKQDYAAYVNLARDYALKYGIPLTLDSGNMYTSGIKSHFWVTQNIWGDHTDPYGYLARFGITKEQLANDLRTGISEENAATPTAPIKPKVEVIVIAGGIGVGTNVYATVPSLTSSRSPNSAFWVSNYIEGALSPYELTRDGKVVAYTTRDYIQRVNKLPANVIKDGSNVFVNKLSKSVDEAPNESTGYQTYWVAQYLDGGKKAPYRLVKNGKTVGYTDRDNIQLVK
ncbi:peptidoglycan recognition protein family protein [Carnobacterium maltaromaticum]|uniref:peptidoglycan recognition protein family protein n=1 Tax=Carnobacterium maltaromaticum TaxID=2751 RepID=UPI00068FF4A5|nr:N-acetylmuramoyl-L-alanine amidase [Carnobacterium maltaromaticum]KRN62098.1 lysin [Carnobacterium maltaromaticum DSM 20342]